MRPRPPTRPFHPSRARPAEADDASVLASFVAISIFIAAVVVWLAIGAGA